MYSRTPAPTLSVSGSATPALRLKRMESGAGRLADCTLPPLPFYEFLNLRGIDRLDEHEADNGHRLIDIEGSNRHFIDCLDLGGYPELICPPTSRSDFSRHVCAEIVDNVPLRDIPSPYEPVERVRQLARSTVSAAESTQHGGNPAFRGRNSPCWRRFDIQRRPSPPLLTLLQQAPSVKSSFGLRIDSPFDGVDSRGAGIRWRAKLPRDVSMRSTDTG